MNMGVYLFLLLFALMFSGMPIALGVGMAAILTTGIWGQIGLELIFQQYYQGVNSFALLAVPLFMLAGELMTRLGLVDDIILLAKLLVGRMRGSLAQINIVASVFFATMSGSAVADTAAIGGMLLPAMEKEGYDKEFSVAVTAASSIIGPIIPPSITMIVYGSLMSNVPTGAMFAAGIVPGVLIGLGEMALVYYFSRKRNYPRETKRYTAKEASAIAVRTLPAVLTPVVIVVAIFSGFCSATEAACIANIWVLITGALYYRRLNLKVFGESVIVAVETAGAILLLNAAAKPLSYLIAMAQLPTMISEAFTSFTSSKIVILLLINVVLLFLGCFMECTANVLIFAPIFAPLAISFGVDPLQFALLFVVNVVCGICTPPFGPTIFLEDYALAWKALELVGMEGMANRRFNTLSGGERQRVLMARALTQQPEALILDEPTNHLDIQYQLQILRVVKSLGIEVFAAMHDLNLAIDYCDYLYVMSRGAVVAEGTPETILEPDLIRTVFGVESVLVDVPELKRKTIVFVC